MFKKYYNNLFWWNNYNTKIYQIKNKTIFFLNQNWMFHDHLTCFYVFIISNVDLIFNVTYVINWFTITYSILFLGYSSIPEVVKMKSVLPQKTHNRDLYLFHSVEPEPLHGLWSKGRLQGERQQFSSSSDCQYLW